MNEPVFNAHRKEVLMQLYIWENTIFVLAPSYQEARDLAIQATRHLPSMASLVKSVCPNILAYPDVHVVFRKGPPGAVDKMHGQNEKVVACVAFRKAEREGSEYGYHSYTSVILRDAVSGTLRTMEVQGKVTLDDFPDGLVHSSA